MKKLSRITIALGIMALVCVSLAPSYIFAWKQTSTTNTARPYFTTHQWLANESLQLSPSSSRIQWITNNLLDFWHGVESPYYAASAAPYVTTYTEDYGDIGDLVLYLDGAGTTVTNDSLADRADEEYNKLVAELTKDDADLELAAFYAGAMCHYISQAGVWGAIWDESLWGTLNTTAWVDFENQIDVGLEATHFENDQADWINNLFTITPSIITAVDAYDATIDLAENIHPVAQSLGDDFEDSWTAVADWTTAYEDDVTDCLTYSAEAMYAALDHAMVTVNWKTIDMEDPVYTYDAQTGYLEIPEFSANYTDNSGTYTVTDTNVELAEFRVIIYPENSWEAPILSPEREDLVYNGATQSWYHPDHLLKGTSAHADHTLLYTFKMNQSSETWSNESAFDFSVNYFKFNMTSINTYYNSTDRTLDISEVVLDIYELPDIRDLEPDEVSSARWILYTKGEGTQVSEAIGIEAYDTEGTQHQGNLTWDATNQSWYALDNDIGMVYTQVRQQYYIVIEFIVADLPIGYYKNSSYGQDVFELGCFAQDTYWFATKDHQITISTPFAEFDPVENLVSVYNITAFTDYQNIELDYYELVTKSVYGQDTRSYTLKVFLFDGIPSSIYQDLEWDFVEGYWFAEDIDVSGLPDNDYYISAKITNMNVNATVSPWGPSSNLFTIKRPVPIIYWILPEFFVAGFVVLFGWLAWWRPRQKRLLIEKERKEKIDQGFMD